MRKSILDAATKCFSERGYSQTSIADIASNVNINEATIYQFFKSKEDILLTIPFEKCKFFLESLSEHLQGIKGPENKLRKLVWYHLHLAQTNREYVTIILVELRHNPNFYNSPAYEMVKEYCNLLLNIIEEGKEEGVFRKEVNGRLVRDMIFGTLDHVILPWVIFKRQSSLTEKSQDVFSLILRAIEVNRQNISVLRRDKKDLILLAAIKLFSEKGFSNSTISEISNLVKVADSTIYEHFSNKEELLFEIPKREFKFFLTNLEELISSKKPENKLRKLVWHHLNFAQTNREYATIIPFELRHHPNFYSSPAYELMKEYSNVLLNIIEEGKEEGVFRKEVNGRLVRDMIFGTLDHVILPWVIFKRQSSLTEKIDDLYDLFLEAIIQKPSGSRGSDV